MLVVTRNDRALRAPIRAFLSSADPPSGFLVNVHDRPGPFMVGPHTACVHGRSHVREAVLGTRFLVSPTAFFQTSPQGADLLLGEVLARATPERPGRARRAGRALAVLDLYAGSGLFAVPLAVAGHAVTAVEENAQAVRDGVANGRLNGGARDRLQFVCARVEDSLPRLARRSVDLVVLDPPRQGTPAQVLEGVFAGISPARAIYVSCNPEALAGELPSILDAGYAIERVQPIDMFPHTPHIETVVTLARGA
jgi:23S rRNA (uracil1939-C5)-methyltransferase